MPREDCERLRAIFVYAKTGEILYDAKELTYQAATAQGPPIRTPRRVGHWIGELVHVQFDPVSF